MGQIIILELVNRGVIMCKMETLEYLFISCSFSRMVWIVQGNKLDSIFSIGSIEGLLLSLKRDFLGSVK